MIGASSRVPVRAEITGTHAGEWFGIAPTGKPFVMPLHEFHRLERGRLTHTWHLEDWFGWMHQVGAFPAREVGTMKAARIHGYNDGPFVDDVPTPEIGATDLLIRVRAAALNPLDVAPQPPPPGKHCLKSPT